MRFKYLILFLSFFVISCAKDTKRDEIIYSNDFETNDLTNLEGGVIESYNGTKVLGRYNNSGFTLKLGNLGTHELVEVSFDLYIHDNWDGNAVYSPNNGPDIWQFLVEGNMYVNTTFSNFFCSGGHCNPQSYPLDYKVSTNNPRTGAVAIDLPGACVAGGTTTKYFISKLIRHQKGSLILQCKDLLVDPTPDRKCDESWSIDNLKVKLIDL